MMLDSPHTSAPMLMRGNALVVSVGGKKEHPQEKAWMLDDSAQWELLSEEMKHFGDQPELYV
jgi:hypothetical protein